MASFCNSGQSENSSNNYGWQDPLGPSSMGTNGQPSFAATGAPQMRSNLFNYLNGYTPQMAQAGQTTASALQTAANNPGWGATQRNATQTAQGDYLNGSPALDKALAWNQAMAGGTAANENARVRDQYAKNGMSFSTGNQEAQQAGTTAANAQADATNAQAYLNNYQAERNAQNNAGNQLATATGTPLNYLSGVSGALTQPLTQAGNLISGLSSGGQVYSTGASGNGTYTPSIGSDIMNGIGAL